MLDTESGDESLSPVVSVADGGDKSPATGGSEMVMMDGDEAEWHGSKGWEEGDVDEEFIFEGEKEEENKPAAIVKWKWVLFALLNLVFFGMGFGSVQDLRWTELARAVAHGAGGTITLNYALLLLSSCKYGWTRLGMVGRGNMHRAVATVMISLSLLLHAAPWTALLCAHVLTFSGPLFDGERNDTKIIVSGLVLTSLILLVLLSTRKGVRSYCGGTLFRNLHPILASLIVVMIFMHANNTSRGIIAVPALLYLCDRIVRVFDTSVLEEAVVFERL